MDPASFSGEDLGDVEDENRNPSHQYIPRVFVLPRPGIDSQSPDGDSILYSKARLR